MTVVRPPPLEKQPPLAPTLKMCVFVCSVCAWICVCLLSQPACVYNLRQAKADIDSIYSTGLFEDVNIVPQEAEDSTETHPKVTHTAHPYIYRTVYAIPLTSFAHTHTGMYSNTYMHSQKVYLPSYTYMHSQKGVAQMRRKGLQRCTGAQAPTLVVAGLCTTHNNGYCHNST